MGNVDVETHAALIDGKLRGIKKDWGIFFTPQWVVDFMVNMIDEDMVNLNELKILEPACGICQFLHGIKNKKNEFFKKATVRKGVEINKEIIDYAKEKKLNDDIKIVYHDYLLWETEERFNIIIGNPPYGIPSMSEHYTIRIDNNTKNKYKRLYETWYGKYNVYGAFIEKSIKLLEEKGQLIFIVPATFMILDEFKKLRKFLSRNGKTEIIYMGPSIFKPEADVTTVVIKFTKSRSENNLLFLYDYYKGNQRLLQKNGNWDGNLIVFSTRFSKKVDEICSFRLGDIYTIRISPRTPEIKHSHDVVRSKTKREDQGFLPILNGRNLKIGKVIYSSITGYWIDSSKKTQLRNFFDKPHIVMGLGFRGDGQVGAAYDYKAYPWMGDVYHLLRKRTLINSRFDLPEEEVVKFLNSDVVRKYVKDVFRDITYHFNITQLKLLPLPTREELRQIKQALR